MAPVFPVPFSFSYSCFQCSRIRCQNPTGSGSGSTGRWKDSVMNCSWLLQAVDKVCSFRWDVPSEEAGLHVVPQLTGQHPLQLFPYLSVVNRTGDLHPPF